MYLLSGKKITCGYGGVDIVSNCNIGVYKGKISSVVGPNGAGKSTAMKALFGLLPINAFIAVDFPAPLGPTTDEGIIWSSSN